MLVRVRAYDPDGFGFLHCLKDSQACSISILEDDICATRDLSNCLFLSGTGIVPVAYVGRKNLHLWIDRSSSLLECLKTAFYWWQFSASNDAKYVKPGHPSCNDSGDV